MATQIYLGYPPENVRNFISSQYEGKRTTVQITGYCYDDGYVEDVFLSSFYDIKNYSCPKFVNEILGDNWNEKYSFFLYEIVKVGNTVERLEDFGLTSFSAQKFEIPDSVSAISEFCFGGSSILLTGIPKNVVEIGENAFANYMPYSYGDNILVFFGRTIEEVQNITDANGVKQYPWGMTEEKISAEYS